MQLIGLHSDCWKDWCGSRPRKDWTGYSNAQIQADLEQVSTWVGEDIAYEREQLEEEEQFELLYGASERRWAEFTA
jgi:hypothetical protein